MRDLVRRAFIAMRDDYSPDRVVADPNLNVRFLTECRGLGLIEADVVLNQCLLNLRKGSDLKGLPRSRRTAFKNEGQYRFASEIAARHLERAKNVSFDRIICDPELAREFDRIAAELAPGYSSLQYRWAALNLRKAKRLQPELLARVAPKAEQVLLGRIPELDITQISTGQGLYIFCDQTRTLYVGEASNLRKRLERHLEHSDIKNLAHWLWEHGADNLYLELHMLPEDTPTPARRALETELIRSRRAEFNIQR